MSATAPPSTQIYPKYFRFPPPTADESYIRTYMKRYFNRYSTYRNKHMQRISLDLYYIMGRQWIEQDLDAMIEGVRGFAFRDMAPDDYRELPQPVTNLIAPAIDVEFATLSKRQWTPKIPSYSRDPRLQAAAKVADDVLNDRLKKIGWEDIRDRFILNCISMGTATLWSYWDESYSDLTWQAAESPVQCAQCGQPYASGQIPSAFHTIMQQGGHPLIGDAHPDDQQTDMGACPVCSGALQPYALQDESEAQNLDFFGRPMGSQVPKGNTKLELVTPFEYYPYNGGLGLTPETTHIHGICKVRSLDWVEEHHPDIIDQISPESPSELMWDHPLLGTWEILGRLDSAFDTGIYDHHIRVYDLIADPSYNYPNGRHIRLLGFNQQHIVINDDLVRTVQSEGDDQIAVKTDVVTSAVWKPREGEFWGKALADDLISPQNRINGMDSQTIDARERMGSPNLMVPEDASLEGPAYRTGYGTGKLFFYQPSPINPQAKPEPFGSILMPSGVYNERNACSQDMTKIIGPADIEIGEAPRNITTTSGLQILGEQAERRRSTRERGITTAFKNVWEHQLKMLWGLRVDVDSYEAELPDGSWEIKEYKGSQLAGQTKVEIERQAYIDKSIVIREASIQAVQEGLYDISTPVARKRLLELQGLPTDVNEDTNIQIEHAKRVWVDFVDTGAIPVIDPSLDNAYIRSQVIGQFLMADEGQQLAQKALWPQILPIIAGWEMELQGLKQADQMSRAFYGGAPPEKQAEVFAQKTMEYQQVSEQLKAAGPAAMGQPPPQPPPPPSQFPQQPEQQVYLVWQNKLQQAQPPWQQTLMQSAVQGMEDPQAVQKRVDSYLRFRAVYEAYRLAAPPAPPPGSEMPAPPGKKGPPSQGPAEQDQGPAPTSQTPPMPPVGATS